MGARWWTPEEVEMLKSQIPSEEIARKLNRTVKSVKRKRERLKVRQVTGFFMPEPLTAYEKEARILKLAKQYGIKLEGETI